MKECFFRYNFFPIFLLKPKIAILFFTNLLLTRMKTFKQQTVRNVLNSTINMHFMFSFGGIRKKINGMENFGKFFFDDSIGCTDLIEIEFAWVQINSHQKHV